MSFVPRTGKKLYLQLGNLQRLVTKGQLLFEVSYPLLLLCHYRNGTPKSCFSMVSCFSCFNGFRLRAWLISTWGA